MNAQQALAAQLRSTMELLKTYVSDFSDADLQFVPVPGTNGAAWQIGHLTASETFLGQELRADYPQLPPVLRELGKTETAQTIPDAGNLTKAEYLQWFEKVRTATIRAVERLTDAELDQANTNIMKGFAPTLGALAVLISNHTMMHAGQLPVYRRALNKPILI